MTSFCLLKKKSWEQIQVEGRDREINTAGGTNSHRKIIITSVALLYCKVILQTRENVECRNSTQILVTLKFFLHSRSYLNYFAGFPFFF